MEQQSLINGPLRVSCQSLISKCEIFQKVAPGMHVAYITGFKGLRALLENHVHEGAPGTGVALGLAMAVAPGVLMTPISSVLEATNAGHMNKEPMHTRWLRGLAPRGAREVIFGLGLNNMTDYFEERVRSWFQLESKMACNMIGSLAAGVVSGYLSHVPHNLSTYKLMESKRSYRDLYMHRFVKSSIHPRVEDAIGAWQSTSARNVARTVLATLWPNSLLIRTTQIVGSFMILNGTINYLSILERDKIKRAVEG